MSAEIITQTESVRLCELERVIQKGKDTFVEVGTALAEIRDSRIYRGTFKTFEDYCEKRWDMGKSHVNRLMEAARVMDNLKNSPIGEVPKTESQARPLAKLPAEQQPAAWEKAQEKAKEEGKPVAARHVEAAVAEVMPKDEPETVVVDEVGTRPTRSNIKVMESNGMAIYASAKCVMDRLSNKDAQWSESLAAMIQYCERRINTKK
jgi:hypothetical protein